MGNIRHPRRGSLQYWPRKRSRHSIARVRSWAGESKTKLLGFIGYKAGMTHLIVTDNHPKSLTKGEQIMIPSTIIDCPPITVMGIAFYKKTLTGIQKVTSILASKLSPEVSRKIQLPKKPVKGFPASDSFDDLRLLVHTNPKLIPGGTKKPKVLEISLGGSKDEKIKYAQEMMGKDIAVADVFGPGNQVDVHGITKGKGFQGTVKRYGIPVRQHKAEKTKRGIATLGSWHPNRVEYSVAQSGKMGYHSRTEYNKQILRVGNDGKDITIPGGLIRYGFVNNSYLLLKGSVAGPKKGALLLTSTIRTNAKITKDAPEINYISLQN